MHIDPYTVMPTSSNKIEEYLEKIGRVCIEDRKANF